MNKITLLILSFCATITINAQTKKNTNTAPAKPAQNTNVTAVAAKEYFVVDLGVFADAKLEDFKNIIKIAYLYAKPLGEGQSQLYVGDFSSKPIADAVLQKVKQQGYSSAFVSKVKSDDEKTTYIQLGARKLGEKIDFTPFANLGKIYTISNDREVKIVSADFANDSIAKTALDYIKKNNIKGAFIQSAPANALHKVGIFESGAMYDAAIIIPKAEVTKKAVEKPAEKPMPAPPPPVAANTNLDSYKGRFSNTQLKAALIALDFYKGKIDNSNDPKLDNAFAQAKEKDRLLAKYVILAQAMKPANEKYTELQQAINAINKNPTLSEQTLKKSTTPIAKAYRSYILFTREGVDIKEVNKLMNQAIQEAYKGVKSNPFAAFDPKATYSYQDLGQVIQHLRYIQGVAKDEPYAPTWLFTEHPKEASAAYSKGERFKIIPTDEFLNQHDELKMLINMAQDIDPTSKVNAQNDVAAAQFRTRMYYLPSTEVAQKQDDMLAWNQSLWKGLDNWTAQSESNKPLYNAFKATYYQALQRYENYFMSKKFTQDDASTLGLNILHETLGKSLEKIVSLSSNSK